MKKSKGKKRENNLQLYESILFIYLQVWKLHEKKIRFTPLNYRKSPIFNLQLQKTWPIQLSKMDKFSLLGGFEGGFVIFFKK